MASTNATNKKGAPTQQAANQFASQAEASRVAPTVYTGFRKPTASEVADAGSYQQAFYGINSTQYPTRPFALDSRDSDVAMLRDLTHGVNNEAPLISDARPYPVQDWELEYMKSKAAQEDYAAYNQWLEQRYDLNDMATRAWFKQIAPDFFTSRRQLLKEMIDRHAKYSYLRFAGPESEEDLRFEYMVETGRMPIPKGPFYDPIQMMKNEVGTPGNYAGANLNVNQQVYGANNINGWEVPSDLGADRVLDHIGAYNKKGYQYGLFNPVKPRTAEQSGNAANLVNQFDIVGDPSKQSYSFPGAAVPTNYNWNTQYNGQNLFGHRDVAAQGRVNKKAAAHSQKGGYVNAFTGGILQAATEMYEPSSGAYTNATPPGYAPISNPRSWNK